MPQRIAHALAADLTLEVSVRVRFGLANLALGLSLELLGFALELFTFVVGQVANPFADVTFTFFHCALDLILRPITAEIVCHFQCSI
jgi:hypothetical protein